MGKVLTNEERRDFSRFALRRPAVLEVAGRTYRCEVVDVSLGGALLRLRGGSVGEAGQRCAVAIGLDQGITAIRMSGRIAHQGEGVVGVRLQEIDLDSVAHLRRVLEMNLGDEQLVARELGAFVARRPR